MSILETQTFTYWRASWVAHGHECEEPGPRRTVETMRQVVRYARSARLRIITERTLRQLGQVTQFTPAPNQGGAA